ncbi:uncharacterized protein NPIL_349721 [Nephila pilipes]|uniref:CCHC-type domain-containing protein n=1 Tax=Nephila pilipes TaxID=299642 RepID=A0A8X6PKS9_NEPPI|nr:uncharacterized protein NPIL_349721 [Nephila pilipes]
MRQLSCQYPGLALEQENKDLKFANHRADPKTFLRTNSKSFNHNISRFKSNKLEERNPMNHKFNVRRGPTRRANNPRTFYSATGNDNGEPRCFTCNNFGHVARDCLFPCTSCGESGHTKKYCTNNKNEPRTNTLSVCDQELSAPDRYLPAHISNHKVTALLDTRSSCYLLKESVANNLELNISPSKKNIYSFGNQLNPVSQSLGATVIDFQVEDVVRKDIYVLIVPDSTQPVDLIVGRPFLDLS